MAGIFDDLREKGNGLLSDLNNYLFTGKGSTLPQDSFTDPDTSGLDYQRGLPVDPTDKTAGQYGGAFDKRLDQYPVGQSTPTMTINNKPYVNPNAKVPNPKNPAENTFLGAVGEYFNNAQKTWKDKGGFDALMSNPQFGVGLSLLQQASEGKTIGSSALKAMVDGGVISDAYAKKIAARAKVIGPATAAQIEQVKARLLASGYGSTPSIYRQIVSAIKGGNATAEQEMAFAEIAQKANRLAEDAAKSGRGQGVEFQVYQDQAILDYIKENGLDKGALNPFNRGSVKGKDKLAEDISKLPKRELGGPVAQGKAYLVGEAGPEVFIAKQTGKIVSTDDSKIINLLLESNPQLKNVSPARAEKILRNRFPDYFE
jgi:hypothetical protein